MRGYFGIGVEGISKPYNVGNLFRSGHAFGAGFIFTVNAHYRTRSVRSDTSRAADHVPYYDWETPDDMILPKGCQLVGVELTEDAVDLPSFRHPQSAAYVFGPERGQLSDEMLAKCVHVVRIPTKFCINVGMAGVVVMYDRMLSQGRYGERPVASGGPSHHGPSKKRTK